MDWGALGAAGIGAGAGIGGTLLGHSLDKKEAKRSRKFVERMSSTAYQRATADMRKAGLNPILAVAGKGGFGAAAPGQAPQAGSTAGTMGSATSSVANSARDAYKASKLIKAQTELAQADANVRGLEGDAAAFVRAQGGAPDIGLWNYENAHAQNMTIGHMQQKASWDAFSARANATIAGVGALGALAKSDAYTGPVDTWIQEMKERLSGTGGALATGLFGAGSAKILGGRILNKKKPGGPKKTDTYKWNSESNRWNPNTRTFRYE